MYARDLAYVTNEENIGQSRMLVVIGLDVTLDGRCIAASGTRSHHGGRTADLLLPVDEILHVGHESIVADDEQFTSFLDGRVSCHRLGVVDVAVLVDGLEFRIQHKTSVTVFDDVAVVIAHLFHAQDDMVIHPQHFRHGVVLTRRDHHVLTSHITVDVGLVEFS